MCASALGSNPARETEEPGQSQGDLLGPGPAPGSAWALKEEPIQKYCHPRLSQVGAWITRWEEEGGRELKGKGMEREGDRREKAGPAKPYFCRFLG